MAHPFPSDGNGLIASRDVRASGHRGRLHATIAAGELEQVRRGVYRLPHATHLSERELAARRYRDRVLALERVRPGVTFTGYSAAALLGLPIVGDWPSQVHVMSRDRHGNRRGGVVATADTKGFETSMAAGCLVTSIEFTLIQLCRRAPLVDALAAMDAALHVPNFGKLQPLTTVEQVRAEHERLLPYPGSAKAQAVLARVTTGSSSPLETGSRLVIEEFGFPEPELQHEFWLPELSTRAFTDFYWPDYNIAAEADGRGKYRGGASLSAATPAELARLAAQLEEAHLREKRRAEALRRQLDGLDRWGWAEMLHKEPVRERLSALGLPSVRRRRALVVFAAPTKPR